MVRKSHRLSVGLAPSWPSSSVFSAAVSSTGAAVAVAVVLVGGSGGGSGGGDVGVAVVVVVVLDFPSVEKLQDEIMEH